MQGPSMKSRSTDKKRTMTDDAGRMCIVRESAQEFHTRRARQELDLAYRTDCGAAMRAHLRLSSLHMQSLKAAGAASGGARRQLSSLRGRTRAVEEKRPDPDRAVREVQAVSG